VFFLGPLGFLVDGLLSEYVFYALLTALLMMVPRQGVAALAISVRFLMGGILLGMFTPVGLLHSAVSAIALEAALFITLLSIRKRTDSGIPLLSVFLFALANAGVSWVSFQLSIVLFRLHYADWFVALSVLVGGLLYALAGAATGRRLGQRLRGVMA
jgi:hypothetical protein